MIMNEIPIFPLPNLVFFPKTFLPLHIFEDRYRRMVEDAHTSEHLIGMVLLKDDWEKDYFGVPAVHDIACVGKIQQMEKLHDGKYNIMLYGMSRVRILKFVQVKPYRIAQVKVLKEINFDYDGFDETYETESFIGLLRRYFQEIGVEQLDELLKLRTRSLEAIINQIVSIFDFSTQEKQDMLEIDSLERRYEQARMLIEDRLVSMKIARTVKIVPENPSWN
ncbi:MAG: LON peptidase substrate-binding domain-containing protein [bacterium]